MNNAAANVGDAGFSGSRAPSSIGDFFGGGLRSRQALLPVAEAFYFLPQNQVLPLDQDYFRAFNVQNTILGPTVQLTNTGFVPNGLGAVRFSPSGQADNLIAINGPFDAVAGVTSIDPGTFTAMRTGLATDAVFSEDVNGNGGLDAGEDFNSNGVIDTSQTIADEIAPNFFVQSSQIYGIYRNVILPQPGDSVGMTKFSENVSPIPRDRLIFDSTFFSGVNLTSSGIPVRRFAPGIEKTFFGGTSSVDVRLPFASTLDSDITTSDEVGTLAAGATNTSQTELGNLSVTGKVLLARNDNMAISIGSQFRFPTASDVRLRLNDANNTELIRIANEAFHVLPFLAVQHMPSDRAFIQYYVQYDRDLNGNSIYYQKTFVDKPREVDFIYGDVSMGYWVYRNSPQIRVYRHGNHVNTSVEGSRGITGFAPRVEFHYNRSLTRPDAHDAGDIMFTGTNTHLESLNLTIGSTLLIGADKELTVAWGTPLLDTQRRDFTSEVRVYFNWLMPR